MKFGTRNLFTITVAALIFFLCISMAAYADVKTVSSPSPSTDKNINKTRSTENKLYVVEPITYMNQNRKGRSQWCVVYSTAMLLSHWGIKADPEYIAKNLQMPEKSSAYFSLRSMFTNDGSVELFIQKEYNLKTKKLLFVTLRESTLDWVKEQVSKGRPVIAIYTRVNGHSVVITGYDDEYVYINDPSGAFFSEASRYLKKNIQPTVWLKPKEERKSRYEGAGVKWSDVREFIKQKNLMGYLITVTGKKPVSELMNGEYANPINLYKILFE